MALERPVYFVSDFSRFAFERFGSLAQSCALGHAAAGAVFEAIGSVIGGHELRPSELQCVLKACGARGHHPFLRDDLLLARDEFRRSRKDRLLAVGRALLEARRRPDRAFRGFPAPGCR